MHPQKALGHHEAKQGLRNCRIKHSKSHAESQEKGKILGERSRVVPPGLSATLGKSTGTATARADPYTLTVERGVRSLSPRPGSAAQTHQHGAEWLSQLGLPRHQRNCMRKSFSGGNEAFHSHHKMANRPKGEKCRVVESQAGLS